MGWKLDDLSPKQKRLLNKNKDVLTEFTIPIELVSPNTYLRWHWAKRAKFKKKLAAHMSQAVPSVPYKGINLSVTRVCLRRITDADNEAFIVKPLLDAMVVAGIIQDDNKNIVKDIKVNQLTRKAALDETGDDMPRTIIKIEVLDD